MPIREELEKQLDSLDATERQEALDALIDAVNSGTITLPPLGDHFNMHCHSFFSFSGYGYSPTALVWRARAAGLCAMGLVDFDVLDGIDEFLNACTRLGLRGGAGLETRVFVPGFSDDEINSPGEPGISYHVGMGFSSSSISGKDASLLRQIKGMAQQRTQTIIDRVNTLLEEIALDYENDVLPLTPAGNVTERHLCAAYYDKSCNTFPNTSELNSYWAKKLGISEEKVAMTIPDPPAFQGLLRSKTMKAGGVGYMQAQGKDFPVLEEVNHLFLANGAIPTMTFLDGTSSGESKMDDLIDTMIASGAAAVAAIPERNWNIKDADQKELKLKKFEAFMQQTRKRDLPIFIGTEMNAYGQRFVDDLNAPELRPYFHDFQEGMYLLNGHTALQTHACMGYLSEWAENSFSTTIEKNRFFAKFGKQIKPGISAGMDAITPEMGPKELLKASV
ncbi:MAG: hypothetical protein KAH38_07680 [Candidatus Hydrogenedentes bacterium]|nr:hypothetical protein [Candidatus Hydrogenedentota bacterium]